MIDLVISDANYNTTSIFHHPECNVGSDRNQAETPKGTHYKIRCRDGKYNTVDALFWIRCRYIQCALMNHPKRSMSHMSTLHKQWDNRGHPLYKERYDLMVGLMRIDGLDVESKPTVLVGADNESPSDIIVNKPRELFRKISATQRQVH